jgi:hypothetical protein
MNESYVKNCKIAVRPGEEPLFYEVELKDGSRALAAKLDGYAVVPVEQEREMGIETSAEPVNLEPKPPYYATTAQISGFEQLAEPTTSGGFPQTLEALQELIDIRLQIGLKALLAEREKRFFDGLGEGFQSAIESSRLRLERSFQGQYMPSPPAHEPPQSSP